MDPPHVDGGRPLDLRHELVGRKPFPAERLRDEIDCAAFEAREREIRPLDRVTAEDDDGRRPFAHDVPERFETVHVRHVEIEGDAVGPELRDALESRAAVFAFPDDFDPGIAFERLDDHRPDERGILSDDDSDLAPVFGFPLPVHQKISSVSFMCRTRTLPSETSKTIVRPVLPPTHSATTGIPISFKTSLAATMFSSPI